MATTYSGIDFHGQEKPKVGMRGDGVKFFLELDQPLRGKVDILQ